MANRRVDELGSQLNAAIESGASREEVVALATQMAAAAGATVGECRLGSDDYADVYPVFDTDGMRWYCTHEEPHRTEVVAQLD